MTTGQKASFSLLITLIFFSAFIVLFHSGFFSVFEKNFYSRIKLQEKEQELEAITTEFNHRIDDVLDFVYRNDDAYLKREDIKSFLKFDPADYEVSGRRHRTEELFYKYDSLRGLRLIDDLQYICYSSFTDTDLTDDPELRNSNNYQRYKKYSELSQASKVFTLENLKSKTNSPKFLVDVRHNFLIIAIPFSPADLSDNIGAIKGGTFVFYFDASVFENELIRKGMLRIGTKFSAVSTAKDLDLCGFIIYSNINEVSNVKNAVLHQWRLADEDSARTGRYYAENLFTQSDGKVLAMLSKDSSRYVRISGVYDSNDFKLSNATITLLYLSLFITFLLVSFFLLSLQMDYTEVIKRRIKKIQMEIISQYLDDKTEIDWRRFANQLNNKKDELSEDIKRSFGKKGTRYSAEIDALLEKSWDEIIYVLKKTGDAEAENSVLTEVKALLEEVLSSGSVKDLKNRTTYVSNKPESEDDVPQQVSSDSPVMHEYTIIAPPEHPVLLDVESVIPEKVSFNSDMDIDLYGNENAEPSDLSDLNNDDDDYKDLITKQEEDFSVLEELEAVDDADDLESLSEAAPGNPQSESRIDVLDGDDIEDLEELEDYTADLEPVADADDAAGVPDQNSDDEVSELESLSPEDEDADTLELIEEVDSIPDETDDVEELETLDEDAGADGSVSELAELEIGKFNNLDYGEGRIVEKAEVIDDMYSHVDERPAVKKSSNPFTSEITKKLSTRYIKSNDTYRQSDTDDFANVDNVFAEELCLGGEYTLIGNHPANFFDITVTSPVLKLENDQLLVKSDIIELESESENDVECTLPENNNDGVPEDMQPLVNRKTFSMTRFGDNIGVLSEIPAADAQAIVEKNGVFSISSALSFTDVVQDPVFKNLVDSVLHN